MQRSLLRRAGGSPTARRRRAEARSWPCPRPRRRAGRSASGGVAPAFLPGSPDGDAARSRPAGRVRPAGPRAPGRAPADRPTTLRRRRGRSSIDPPVELLARIEFLVAALVGAEPDRLLVAEAEHAEVRQALVEESMHAILQRAV